jgi:hypothetical protein
MLQNQILEFSKDSEASRMLPPQWPYQLGKLQWSCDAKSNHGSTRRPTGTSERRADSNFESRWVAVVKSIPEILSSCPKIFIIKLLKALNEGSTWLPKL